MNSTEVVCQSPQLGHFQAHSTWFNTRNTVCSVFFIAKKNPEPPSVPYTVKQST